MDSKFIAPVVYFDELVKTSLWQLGQNNTHNMLDELPQTKLGKQGKKRMYHYIRAYCPNIYTVDLGKTEEEIITLRNVLASKEAHAQELKHRLGITAWREFSEDMNQGLKKLKDSQAYKKTGEAFTTAKSKTASVWSSISNSQSLNSAGHKMASAFEDAKTKVTASFSRQNSVDANGLNGDGKVASDATEGNKVSILTGTT